MPMLNLDPVANIQIALKTAEPYSAFACIKRVRQLDFFSMTSPDEAHSDGHDHFASPFVPLACAKAWHVRLRCTYKADGRMPAAQLRSMPITRHCYIFPFAAALVESPT